MVAASGRDALLANPLENPQFVDWLYSDYKENRNFLDSAFSQDGLASFNDNRKFSEMVRQTRQKHNVGDRLLPGVARLAEAIQACGKRYGLVIVSGMPADVAYDKFKNLNLNVRAAYWSNDDFFDRSKPASFRHFRVKMNTMGALDGSFSREHVVKEDCDETYSPKLYWTSVRDDAVAAAHPDAWGRAMLCVPNDYKGDLPNGYGKTIRIFTLKDLESESNIQGIVNFVYAKN